MQYAQKGNYFFIIQFISNFVIVKITDHTIPISSIQTGPGAAVTVFSSRGQFIVGLFWALPDAKCLEVDE